MKLKGIMPPVVTPFQDNTDQDVDVPRLRELTDFLLGEGVHGLVVCAGNGEGVHLSLEEKRKVTEVSVDRANGKVPVIVGVFATATALAVGEAKQAKDAGADAVLVTLPYYFHHSDEGLFQHFKSIAEKADIPVVIYNLRFFSGYDIEPRVVARLADVDNIVGIKLTTDNLWQIAEILRLCGDKMAVFAGNFDIMLHTMELGGKGCITGFINCLPALHIQLYEYLEQRDMKKATELYNRILPFWRIGPNAAKTKAVLNILGHKVGIPRRPLLPATADEQTRIREGLKALGYLK
jgi:4-hydroxy-tetrahydrodipicolinate synthase